jgi:hypothetical protein
MQEHGQAALQEQQRRHNAKRPGRKSPRESGDGRSNGRSLQVCVVRYNRTIPVRGRIVNANLCPSSPTQCATPKITEAVGVAKLDRLVFVGIYHLAPKLLDAVKIL